MAAPDLEIQGPLGPNIESLNHTLSKRPFDIKCILLDPFKLRD